MNYSNQLRQIEKARMIEQYFSTSILDNFNSQMTNSAREYNTRHSQDLLNIYDYKIAQLQPLVQKENQQQIVSSVLEAITSQNEYISEVTLKSIRDLLEGLKL